MHSTIENLLNQQHSAISVVAHAKLLLRLNRRYTQIVGDTLGTKSHIANLKANVLIIHADNAAVASKLRQMHQRLLRELSNQEFQFNELEVKVQPQIPIPNHTRSVQVKPISALAEQAIQQACETVNANSELGKALQNLLKRAKG